MALCWQWSAQRDRTVRAGSWWIRASYRRYVPHGPFGNSEVSFVSLEPRDRRAAVLRITAEEGEVPEFRDVVAFETDLNLYYELAIAELLEPGSTSPGSSSASILSRIGRRVPKALRMRVAHVQLGSPFIITLLLPSSIVTFAALLLLVERIEKIYNLHLQNKLLIAQTTLAGAETRVANAKAEALVRKTRVHRRRQVDPVKVVGNRLRRSPIQVTDVVVEERHIDVDVREWDSRVLPR